VELACDDPQGLVVGLQRVRAEVAVGDEPGADSHLVELLELCHPSVFQEVAHVFLVEPDGPLGAASVLVLRDELREHFLDGHKSSFLRSAKGTASRH
jgi:hypothetical protein